MTNETKPTATPCNTLPPPAARMFEQIAADRPDLARDCRHELTGFCRVRYWLTAARKCLDIEGMDAEAATMETWLREFCEQHGLDAEKLVG